MTSELSLGLTGNKYIGRIAGGLRRRHKLECEFSHSTNIAEAKADPDTIPWLEKDLRSHHRSGMITLAITLVIIIVWAGLMPLAGAVVVGGTFVIHSSVKKVQHKSGGVVKEINVHEGSKVNGGDILVKLDDTDTKAEALAIARQIDETQLRIARLTAERDGAANMTLPKFLTTDDEHQKAVKSELDFFKVRQQTQHSVQRLADSRVTQLERQIKGLQAQLHTNKRQKDITGTELAGMEELFKKKIAPIQRLTPLQREKARLEGSDDVIISSEQETLDKINEIKLQAQQAKQSFHADVVHDLSDASAKLGQLLEQYIVVNQAFARTSVVAPVSGVVHELNVHTLGGVVSPAETLMTIVPDDDRLEVAIRLASDKIDQVRKGQRARVKLTAFERTTPDIEGAVSFISPDLVESKAGAYYDVRVAVDQHPHGMNLAPGMPAEVFLETDKRTLMSYLVKPITENMSRMFRER